MSITPRHRPPGSTRSNAFLPISPEKQIRRGVHRSTAELEAAIKAYIETVNVNSRPFVWAKSADDILATIKRFCFATLKTDQPQVQICKISESGHSGAAIFCNGGGVDAHWHPVIWVELPQLDE